MLDREVKLEKPRATYRRGWGPKSADSSDIVASWAMYVQDMNGRPAAITFDVANDESPLIIGMDLKWYSMTDNIATPPRIIMRRPTDNRTRILETYMTIGDPLRARLRLLVVPMISTSALTGESRRPMRMRPMTIAKRIHCMTHAHPLQISKICEEAGWLTPELADAIKTVSENCPSCTISGPPAPSKKISLNHDNEDYNVEIQPDFTYLNIRGHVYPALHIIDTGTGYS